MEKRKRIALYSPYIPEHQGGGERYMMSVAEVLSRSHEVCVLIRGSFLENEVREKYERAFHLDLSRVSFFPTLLGTPASAFAKLRETAQYGVMYYLTDGSLFFSAAKKNVLHIQFPFTFPMHGVVNRIKLAQWGVKNANSMFTRGIVERAWHTSIPYVHYPYVDAEVFKPGAKDRIILSVGRFFTGEKSGMHCKRQDVLVRSFISLVRSGKLKGWKLVLIGSIDPGEDNRVYAEKVRALAKGHPIKILHDASFDVLRQYNAAASIYWHAAGFGVDEQKEPTKVEHFGIAVLEAMASGAVPVVIGKGGIPEIVEHHISGYLWQTDRELEQYTAALAQSGETLRKMSDRARARAMIYNKERFAAVAEEMVA